MGEIFGIGIEELIFIGILIALLLGPENIPKLASTAGRWLNRLFRSPVYQQTMQLRQQIPDLPTALMRLAKLEEMQQSLNSEISKLKSEIDQAAEIDLTTSTASGTPAPTTQPAAEQSPSDSKPNNAA